MWARSWWMLVKCFGIFGRKVLYKLKFLFVVLLETMQLLEKILGTIWERKIYSKTANILNFRDREEIAFIFFPHTPLLFTNTSLYIYANSTGLMSTCAEAPPLPELFFWIGYVQHIGDKFRLRRRGMSGPSAAPPEACGNLPAELNGLFRGPDSERRALALLVLSSCLAASHVRRNARALAREQALSSQPRWYLSERRQPSLPL